MFERPSTRTTWLPLGLAIVALVVLNLGLYTRLSSQPEPLRFNFPYTENFSALSVDEYELFGGDWEIRDETLVQLSTSGYDLMSFVPIDIPPEQNYTYESSLRYLGGIMGGGLIFNAQQITSRQKSQMLRFNVDNGVMWLIYGYFGDDSNFVGQGSAALDIPLGDPNWHRLRVQVDSKNYALFIDDTVMASEVPLVYHGGAVGFISATSQVAFDDVRVGAETVANPNNPKQPAEQVQQPLSIDTETNNLFADISNGNSSASLWQAISGEWRFEQGAYTQTQLDGFDLSMIYQHAFNSPFTMLTTFQLKEGSGGGGLLFNLPAANTKNGGYMVRYFENGSVLAWGYFDENGAFFGQGSVSVTPAEKDVHTLGVHVSDQSYSIELDGTEMAGNVPLRATTVTGYLGLTASQSVVTFNDVSVSAPINQTMPMANIDTELATGNWVVESNTISQLDTGNMDFVAGTGLAGERFTFKADITLPPDNTNAGAGIVFHMDGRDDLSLGYMVRFGNGGRELFWGQYDEVGNFVGKGGIPLEPTAGIKRELMLVVHDTSLDIWLDGMSIVKAIPLERSSGWIGLISFSGPVSFSNVNLQLGE